MTKQEREQKKKIVTRGATACDKKKALMQRAHI
jgi:hypothetical protein